MRSRFIQKTLTASTTILLLSLASSAHAVQNHGGTEGLISHEIGHILFATAMIVLLIRMNRSRLKGPGWDQFRVFLLLIISWNVLTFAGHWMREFIDSGQFIYQNGQVQSFRINGLPDLLFYLTRLDHILLVPAFFMLMLAIFKWSKQGP